MPCAFATDGDVIVAYEEVVTHDVRCLVSRVVGEDDWDGRGFKGNHTVRAVSKARNDAVDTVAHGVFNDIRRQFAWVLHEPDLPVVPGVYKIEHTGKTVPPRDVAYCKRDNDILAFHGWDYSIF